MSKMMEDDGWPYCPKCGSILVEPAGPYHEWTDCPNCGRVHIIFYTSDDAEPGGSND